VVFGYVGQVGDVTGAARDRYRSAEYQTICWDELTAHFSDDYEFLFSRLRKRVCPKHKVIKGEPNYVAGCWWCDKYKNLPLRVRSASNPGGIGHIWVKDRFLIKETSDAETGEKKYIGMHPERPYIPAFVWDNPYIDQASYLDSLDHLDSVTREQLKKGDWGVSQDSRFKKNWFRYYSVRGNTYVLGRDGRGPHSELQRVFACVDPAGSAKEGPDDDKRFKKQPSWTVIAVFGLTYDYHLLVLDVRRFRKEVPDILPEMRDVYRQWRPQKFRIEAAGLGKGVFQLAQKYGLPVEPIHPHHDKIVRSTDAQVRMEQGRIWFPQPPGPSWLEKWEAEFLTWTGHPQETDDQIDVLSYAAMDVSWEAAAVERSEDEVLGYTTQDLPSIVFSGRHFGAMPQLPYYG
jgi:predicted phage terminase large subunit-like protein